MTDSVNKGITRYFDRQGKEVSEAEYRDLQEGAKAAPETKPERGANKPPKEKAPAAKPEKQ